MNFKKNWKRFWTVSGSREGFTLVELIVVIAILAILAGVTVPAYSGYVKKAERAADEQLLNALNTAFASACAINGEAHFGQKVSFDKINTNNGWSIGEITVSDIDDFYSSFKPFFEGGEFKAFDAIIYNAKTGMFMEATAANYALYERIREEYGDEIATLMASNLGAMGAETLLTETAGVVAWAAEYGLLDLAGPEFNKALAGYLGLGEDATNDEMRTAIMALAGNDANLAAEISANAIALYAAQNSENVTKEGIESWLGGDAEAFKGNVNANTLSEAAAIYGLYMSFKGDEFDSSTGAMGVLNQALTDDEFASWINSTEGASELDAYKAAMGIISGSTQDESTTESVLTGGFDNPELIALLESLMGN